MYSPKISEQLIPVLYKKAKEQHLSMTRLVNSLIREALADEYLPQKATESEADSAAPAEQSRNVA